MAELYHVIAKSAPGNPCIAIACSGATGRACAEASTTVGSGSVCTSASILHRLGKGSGASCAKFPLASHGEGIDASGMRLSERTSSGARSSSDPGSDVVLGMLFRKAVQRFNHSVAGFEDGRGSGFGLSAGGSSVSGDPGGGGGGGGSPYCADTDPCSSCRHCWGGRTIGVGRGGNGRCA